MDSLRLVLICMALGYELLAISRMRKDDPTLGSLCTRIIPSCKSTRFFTKASPMPNPGMFFLKLV